LRNRERIPQWLSGIAHNVCLRWARKQGRNLLQFAESLPLAEDAAQVQFEESVEDDFDIEAELERKELIELLDRALALLTPEARTLLIARYIEETPLAEVAAQLGMKTGAVTMRLQRGKIALRRVLATELRHELAPYRMDTTGESGWEETPLWCMSCGQRRIIGRYRQQENELWLKCPVCCPEANHFFVHTHSSSLLSGVKGYRRAFSRIVSWVDTFFLPHLASASVTCYCGRNLSLQKARPGEAPLLPYSQQTLYCQCAACGFSDSESLQSLVFVLPRVQRFYRQHPRLRFLPGYEVEADGRAAIVTSIESITNHDRVAVVSAADTFEMLRLHTNAA
jgi:RNA polymerase sigma factor (sigma-70 family)